MKILTDFLAKDFTIDNDRLDKIFAHLDSKYQAYKDPWGLDLKKARKYTKILYPLYKHYFKVRVFGKENILDRNYMFVANHSGQIAFDGLLVSMAGVVELDPPQIPRGMIERWMASLPFFAELAATGGSILGDRNNCLYLLERKESILVFPEGIKGVSKSTSDFYKLQKFTTGFLRMSAAHNTPIVPMAIIGAEETYPWVYQADFMAKKLKFPAFPLTPFFPLFGPLGFIPLPSPVDIYFGEPYFLPQDIKRTSSDDIINEHVLIIKKQIKSLIKKGLKNRRPFLEKFGMEDKREL